MANRHGVEHNPAFDDEIAQQIEGGQHGAWHEEDGKRVFTPKMSFFDKVAPFHLASYFVEHGGDDLRLNLP